MTHRGIPSPTPTHRRQMAALARAVTAARRITEALR